MSRAEALSDFWHENNCNHERWEKVLISIGSALEKNSDLEGMKHILSLSYYDLPYYLKTCLLCLSLYPEDFKIERDNLIQQWIAEGFINEERGQSVEDVAESYFNELIRRSMVQPMDINCDGKAHACRVHDMMHELIISKAIEENFVTLLGGDPVEVKPQGIIRRLSVQYEYLNLRRTWISKLPPQIGDLQTLETLDIRDTNIIELPGTIIKIGQLKYVLSSGHTWGKIKLPDGIGSMASLRVISGFDICCSSTNAVQELGNLKSLRELTINWTDFTSATRSYDEYSWQTGHKKPPIFRNLQSQLWFLGILRFLVTTTKSPSEIPAVCILLSPKSSKVDALCNLIDLDINIEELTNEDIHILRDLPSLLRLDLFLKSPQKEHRIVIHGVGFPYLKELFFTCEGTWLICEPEALPKLERLQMAIYVKEAKPYVYQFGIEHLRSIKKVYIQLLCAGTSGSDIENVEEQSRSHPIHPRVDIQKYGMDMPLEERNKRQHFEDNNAENGNTRKEDMNHTNKKRKQ
uniref:NB-ARC domain-containing protein n=1 Tax=Leersia perrieri TaxID=77586 RepID=A0A0D9XT18_9ORYZ